MKRQDHVGTQGERKPSVAATAGFVLVTVLLAYGAARLLFGTISREFTKEEASMETPAAAAEGLQPGKQTDAAQAVFTPSPAELRTQEPPKESVAPETTEEQPERTPLPHGTVLPEGLPEELPAAAIGVQSAPKQFSCGALDLVFGMTDTEGNIECVAVLVSADERTTLLSLPGNCRAAGGALLSEYAGEQLLEAVGEVVPVQYGTYAYISKTNAADCIDALGSLFIAGKLRTGEETLAYLDSAGKDPLLTAERFAVILQALTEKLHELPLLRMLAAKNVLQAAVKTNLKEKTGWALYRSLVKTDTEAIRRRTIPVDSALIDGRRCYMPDETLMESLFEELYKS